jgi:hypothetical protein
MTLAGIKEPPFQIENRRFEITEGRFVLSTPADAKRRRGGPRSDEARSGERLLKKARNLARGPPGVYLMKDHKGVVIYVGKAARCPTGCRVLRAVGGPGGVKKGCSTSCTTLMSCDCEGEWEALLTENRLIKDIKPKFNVRLTDDKTFPYLVVTQKEDFRGCS